MICTKDSVSRETLFDISGDPTPKQRKCNILTDRKSASAVRQLFSKYVLDLCITNLPSPLLFKYLFASKALY